MNSDFDKYVNNLNEITNQENRAELESFYTLHSAVLQFFKAIDKSVQDALNKANVGTIVLKQLETVLPTLTKLKKEFAALDTREIANGFKTKINQSITLVKNKMTLSEVNDTAQHFFDLLKENKAAFNLEQENKTRREKERAEAQKEKERREIKLKAEAECKDKAERERKTKEERERPEREAKLKIQREAYAYNEQAVALFGLRKYKNALVYNDLATKLLPNDAVLWYNKATTLINLNKTGEAIASINQAIKLAPNNKRYRECYDSWTKIKSGCFVATACFGDYNAPEVFVLRQYRDNTLLPTYWGRFFVKFYYFVSPPIARQIEKSEKVKLFIRRHLLNPIIRRIK
jgi:tetratricopeptide (TPR) repeat protein